MDPIAKKVLDYLKWRGWYAGGLNHPEHGKINVTEALLQVVEYDIDIYTDYIEKMCKVINVDNMVELVLWEQHKNRNTGDIEWLLSSLHTA